MKRRNMLAVALLVAGTLTPAAPVDATSSLRAWCGKVHNELPHAEMIRETFPEAPIMTRVSCCESKGNPRARSRTQDYGLGQVHWPVWGRALREVDIAQHPTDLLDPGTGVSAMRFVYDVQGLRAWRPSRGCWG